MEVARGAAEADALVACGVRRKAGWAYCSPLPATRTRLKKSIEIATVSGIAPRCGDYKGRGRVAALAGASCRAGGTPPAQLLLEAVSSSELAARDQKAKPAMASMLGLAKALAKLPGRKTIVYFSGGLQLSTSEATVFQSLVSESNLAA